MGKEEQSAKYAKRASQLLQDTAYFSLLIFSTLWCFSNTVFTPISYFFGAFCGIAYTLGLSKYVETLGDSDAMENIEGVGLGQARFAFLVLLFILLGKYRPS